MRKILLTVGISTAVIFGVQAQETPTKTKKEKQQTQQQVIEARGDVDEETYESEDNVQRTNADATFSSKDMSSISQADLPKEIMESFENSDYSQGSVDRAYEIDGEALPQILESRANLSMYPGEQLPEKLYILHVSTDEGKGILYIGDDGESIAEEEILNDETTDFFGEAGEAIEETANDVGNAVGNAAEATADGVETAVNKTGEFVDDAATEVKESFNNAEEEVEEEAAEFEEAAENTTGEAVEDVDDEMEEAANETENAVESAAYQTEEAMKETANDVENAAEKTEEEVEEAAYETENTMENTATQTKEGWSEAEVEKATTKTEELVEGTASEAKMEMNETTQEVNEETTEMNQAAEYRTSKAATSVDKTVEKAEENVENAVENTDEAIEESVKSDAYSKEVEMENSSASFNSEDMSMINESDIPQLVKDGFSNSAFGKGTIEKAYKVTGSVVSQILQDRAAMSIYAGEQLPETLYQLQVTNNNGAGVLYIGDDGEIIASENL